MNNFKFSYQFSLKIKKILRILGFTVEKIDQDMDEF